MQKQKRKLELAVISDVHLGTYGSQPKYLLRYLKSIQPKTLIVNGDLIDFWAFSKRYWPKSHMQILIYLLEMARSGVEVYYLTGNHDEMMRKFVGFKLGGMEILNQLILDCDGKKAWVFHGDAFDVSMRGSKRMAKIGGWCYDGMVQFNRLINLGLQKVGMRPVFFSKWLKDTTKKIINKVSSLEGNAAKVAVKKGYDYVVCGHVHKPEITEVEVEEGGKILYLNSGDWIENLTALEWDQGEWRLFEYKKDPYMQSLPEKMVEDMTPKVYSNQRLFRFMEEELGVREVNASQSK